MAHYKTNITVAGLPVEVLKTVNYYDIGGGGDIHLVPYTYDYHLKVWGGDLGEMFDHPFDGHLIRWRRVAMVASESAEYVAESVTPQPTEEAHQ